MTNHRRGVQREYNKAHGIDPQTIRKAVTDILAQCPSEKATAPGGDRRSRRLKYAARLRDEVAYLNRELWKVV